MKSTRKLFLLAFFTVSALSYGQTVMLDHGGSHAEINAGPGGTDPQGLFNWTIGNGPNNVGQELYLVRIGGGDVTPVNAISSPQISQQIPNLASIGYTDSVNQYDLNFQYLLVGAAPNHADLSEVTTLTNHGSGRLTFSLFEYDFFRPGGVYGGTGRLLNSSTIRQTNDFGSITVGATPIPDHYMIDTSANVGTAILAGNLTDSSSTFSGDRIAFAFQWDVTLAPGESWQMSKDKQLAVPEPGSIFALGLGLVALARRRRK